MNRFGITCVLAGCLIMTGGCATHRHSPKDPMPAFREGSTILFQGDSITDGNRGRNPDPNHILGHGYQALVASRFGADLPERHLLFINRGISGNKVSDLAARWQKDAIDLKPDVLSILIGVNDLGAGVTTEGYERQYDALLAETRRALPNTRLVLGEPFGLASGGIKERWPAYSAELKKRQTVVSRLGAKYGAPVVKYQAVFEAATQRAPAEYWIWDGVHPTYAGHQLMADEWVRTVRTAWPEKR